MRQINFISWGGAKYSAPTVDMLNVCAEHGFAASDVDFGVDSGESGTITPGVVEGGSFD